MKANDTRKLEQLKNEGMARLYPDKIKIVVGMATCGLATGAGDVFDEIEKQQQRQQNQS